MGHGQSRIEDGKVFVTTFMNIVEESYYCEGGRTVTIGTASECIDRRWGQTSVKHRYVVGPEDIQIAMSHYVDGLKTADDWKSLDAPAYGTGTFIYTSTDGEVTLSLPNSQGINSAPSPTPNEDLLSLDQIIRGNRVAKDYFYGSGDASSYTVDASQAKGRDQGMKLKVTPSSIDH